MPTWHVLKDAPIARQETLFLPNLLSSCRVDSDTFKHIGESIQFGLFWQTEALECPKNIFTEIAILTNY